MARLILDHSALAAMGRHPEVSALIVEADEDDRQFLRVPALCLTAAESMKAGVSRHVGFLSSLEVMDLTRAETAKVGALIALGVDWRKAHAVALAREYRCPVVTLQPEGYSSYGVETITLGS